MEYKYPELGNVAGNKTNNSYLAFVADAKLMEDAEDMYKSLKETSDYEFDFKSNSNATLAAYSSYDRMMMKRKMMQVMKTRLRGIQTVQDMVSGYVQTELLKRDKQSLAKSLGAPTPYTTH